MPDSVVQGLIRRSYTHAISLGFNCFPKKWLQSVGTEPSFYLPFDFTGSSVWSITHLINTDFKDFPSQMLKRRKVIQGEGYVLTDEIHYVRFPHDELTGIREKYKRRVKRLQDIVGNLENNILFIRMEERMKGRIPQPGVTEISEHDQLGLLTSCLTERNVSFRILYINREIEYQSEKMMCVKANFDDLQWSTVIPWFDEIMGREDIKRWLCEP